MVYWVMDAETDGLLDVLTKLHCVVAYQYTNGEKTAVHRLTRPEDLQMWLNLVDASGDAIVGHNIVCYDRPALIKLGFEFPESIRLIDTLALSFYLYCYKGFKHGLQYWGERAGIAKPEVEDWENQPIEVYLDRCEKDVMINVAIFHKFIAYLIELYNGDSDSINAIMDYLSWKMDCLREQEEHGISFDRKLAQKSLHKVNVLINEKSAILSAIMPEVVFKRAPKKMLKQDGEVSALGMKWLELLETKGLSRDTTEIMEPGNPGSVSQMKDWLYGMGWEPAIHKENTNGEPVAQMSKPFGGGLCDSIKDLYAVEPRLEELDQLAMLKHRAGIFKGFLKNERDGKVFARFHGFTNTLRVQHAVPVVNLPGVDKPWGKEIRGMLTVPDETYMMIGSDISGLEDRSKMDYMFPLDPTYVNEMDTPTFDAHCYTGMFAGMMTESDYNWYTTLPEDADGNPILNTPEDKVRYKGLKGIRKDAKVVNFSAVYGAGAQKIADTLKKPFEVGAQLHLGYWKLNWSVKEIANTTTIKTVNGQTWQLNPRNKFWYFLKDKKDAFSTLNQGGGAYIFDMWVRNVRNKLKPYGIPVVLQYHDEILLYFKTEMYETVRDTLQESMVEVNERLQLNVTVRISVDPGLDYAECH